MKSAYEFAVLMHLLFGMALMFMMTSHVLRNIETFDAGRMAAATLLSITHIGSAVFIHKWSSRDEDGGKTEDDENPS